MKKIFSILKFIQSLLTVALILTNFSLQAQFAGPAGSANSSAIAKDSSIIVAWANNCSVQRGYVNITDPTLGQASTGTANDATGPADEIGVVSLGDSGVAILSFPYPIFNGLGPDFAVFENAFNDSFLELGHVEVSSDGINYFRFPSTSNTQSSVQINSFDQLGMPEKINNLAGKYRGGYGTPFDLEELSGITGLDIDEITHVKIIDAVGSINPQYGTQDQNGNLINDPFPTAFPSGGFDLDAVGVCHMQFVNSISESASLDFKIYPNPVKNQLKIQNKDEQFAILEITDNQGHLLLITPKTVVDFSEFPSGIYHVKVTLISGKSVTKRIIKL